MEKEQITYFFKKLYEQGAITLFEGNISAKTDDGLICMTPSQQSKERLHAGMIVTMDADGHGKAERNKCQVKRRKINILTSSV